MSAHPQPSTQGQAPPRQDMSIGTAFADQRTIFGLASLASLAVIIGGVGPWATWLNSVSISGTSMHGWREVSVGGIGLFMLWLYQQRGWRLPLIVTVVFGCLGAIFAIAALHKIQSGGAITLYGVQYRYANATWGLYLVLVGAIAQAVCAAIMVWRDVRGSRMPGRGLPGTAASGPPEPSFHRRIR